MEITLNKFHILLKVLVSAFLIFCFLPSLAQNPEDYDENGNLIVKSRKGFLAGLYLGAYFPNANTASLYDGYGFDFEENKNLFENSWMHEKIINQYGGGYGDFDYIAEALGVEHDQWNFDESDMPTNMRYNTTFAVGFSGRYSTDKKNAVLLNINAAILTAAGNFTITTTPLPGSTQVNNAIKTFNIRGKEQRLFFQGTFQHIFGSAEAFNLFAEAGLHATLAQFYKNEIEIEDLRINLYESYYNPINGATYETGPKPVGLGFGVMGGAGFNFHTNARWDFQFVYDLMLENVRIGYDQHLTLGHGGGIRLYYMLSHN